MRSHKASCRSLLRRIRETVVTLILIALLAPAARAVEPQGEIYVVNLKPPSVSILDAADWMVVGTIPLDPDPTAALIEPENRFLYVLHRGFFRPDGMAKVEQGALAVIDVQARTRLKTIPLAWNTTDLVLTRDGRYLICVSEGKKTNKKKPDEYGSVTVVDTRTNEVTATLPAGRLGLKVAVSGDASRIFVLSLGEIYKKKNGAASVLTAFAFDSPKPVAEIPLGRAQRLALSSDEKWLYVLDAGLPSKKPQEHLNGTVHVFEMGTAAAVGKFDVGTSPRGLSWDEQTSSLTVLAQTSAKETSGRLFRLRGAELQEVVDVGTDPRYVRRVGDRSGMFVVSQEDMRFLPDGSSSTSSSLLLNPQKGAKQAAETKTLDGYPGELLFLPDQNRVAMSVLNAVGGSSKVAILNLKDNRIEHVVTTGRGSVKVGLFLGSVALSAAMTSLSYYAGYSAAQASGAHYFFYNVYTFAPPQPNMQLAASSNGEFVYALNTQTNDVTIVKVADGTVIDRIPVGGGCRRVALAPGGRFVYAYTQDKISLIDTRLNQKRLEHSVTGRVHNVYVFEPERRLVALTSKSLLIWDAETGELARSVDGLSEPFLIVSPRQK